MDTLVWATQGLLSFVFLMAGLMKMIQSKDKVIASGGKWAEDFAPTLIKVIGIVEVVLAVGLTLPRILGHGHVLTSASAAGLAVVMMGAFFTHLRRKEHLFLLVTGLFFILASLVCYAQFPFPLNG